MSRFSRVQLSSASDHWETPEALLATLRNELALDFDPCPLMSSEDGLTVKWTGKVFCNPPYSKIAKFIRKGLYHLANGDCSLLAFLLPSRTDVAWFHDYCIHAEIRFIRGRLRFSGYNINAPFPSMVVIFREWKLPILGIAECAEATP